MTPAQDAAGRLLVCPTPIGNLRDVTLRVLDALADADVVACEDTRHTRTLLQRHGLSPPLVSLHEHNEASRTKELLRQVRGGAVVALVSDAGTPLISDPGFALVRECQAQGLTVEVLPGPSAVTTALVASGLPAERWLFAGFLPRKQGELRQLLANTGETLVAFESPRRLAGTLRVLATLDHERPLAVCRELSKRHEEVRRGSAAELSAHYSEHPPRGELVLVIGGAARDRARSEQALAALSELVAAGARARPAASAVSKLTGVSANELYGKLTGSGQ